MRAAFMADYRELNDLIGACESLKLRISQAPPDATPSQSQTTEGNARLAPCCATPARRRMGHQGGFEGRAT